MNISYMQFSFIFFYLANHFFLLSFTVIYCSYMYIDMHYTVIQICYIGIKYAHLLCTDLYINLFYILYVERYINRPRFHIWGRNYIFCEICILLINIKHSTLNIHSFSWNNSNFNFKIIPSQSFPQISHDV